MLGDMVGQLGNGLVLGAVIAVASVGLSLIFGVTGIVNFSHGDLVTLGAFTALWLSQPAQFIPGGQDLPFIWALLITLLIGAAVGALLELVLFRPLRKQQVGTVTLLVVTIGLGFVIRYLILVWSGGDTFTYRLGPSPVETYLGFLDMRPRDMVVLVVSIVVLVAFGLFLSFTKLGTAMRAVSDNEDLAESSGIDADQVYVATWALGISLAFLGGIFQGLTQDIRWSMGFFLLLLMFAAIILGGIGNPFGAMVGGFIIGIVVTLAGELPFLETHRTFRIAIGLGVMVLILLFRPQGILGRAERVS